MVGAWVPMIVVVIKELVFSLLGWERTSLLNDGLWLCVANPELEKSPGSRDQRVVGGQPAFM